MTRERTADGLTSGSRELRRLNTAMLFAALAAFGLLYATQALLPSIGADFGVGPTAASLTVSAATGALALVIVPLSSVAESRGRVPVMRAGLLTACLLTFVAAASPAFWVLVAVRGLVGGALAAVVAVAVAHLGDEVHPAELGTAIGIYVAGNTLGGIGGRLIPGLVEESTSWRAGVTLLAVAATAATVLFTRLLPPARRPTPTSTGPRHHAGEVRDLLRDPGVVRLCVLAFLLMGGFVACYNYLTFRLESPPLHLSTTITSLLFLAYLAGTVSSPVAGRLSDRFGPRRPALLGIALSVGGLALMLPDRMPTIAIGLLVFTAGFFATHSVASSWVSSRAAGRRGQAAAMYLLAYYLGSSIFGALIGLAYQSAGWPAAAAAIGTLFLLGAWTVLGVPADRGDT
ncbi:MAG TPA: MFS transporter [Nocardioidaceae bacterium]|nr:MFS transporter [Nocardioidaceae bacterium]